MKTIKIQVGELDRISFSSNSGSTGYIWMLASLSNGVYLVDVDDQPPAVPMPGKPGTRTFTIVGAHPSKGKLVFLLARPWELQRPVQRVIYEVVVEPVHMHDGPVVLYGPALTEAKIRGDLAEMKEMAAKAREALAQQGELAKALADLETEIDNAGG